MYKVVIADDEKIIRTGLQSILDWEMLGFEVAGVFADGEEILEYLDYAVPEVILTDVKMVNVSGLEVARYVLEHQYSCKVVLISGFHEFDLALKALKYGAHEYLLKPIDPNELEQTFHKIRRELDEEKAQKVQNAWEQSRMRELQAIVERQFLEELVLGAVKGESYLRNRFEMIYPALDWENSVCFLLDMKILDFERFLMKIWGSGDDNFEDSLDEYLRGLGNDYLYRVVYKNSNVIRILAICRRKVTSEPKEVARELVEQLQKNYEFAVDYHFQGVYPNILALAERIVSAEHDKNDVFQQTQFNEQIMLMLSNAISGNHIRAQELLHSILDYVCVLPENQRNQQVWSILNRLKQAMVEAKPHMQSSLRDYILEKEVLDLHSQAELGEYCDRVFDYIRMAQTEETSNVNELVLKAKKYICENIFRDVSREEVAAKLFICPSYLSKLFVKETGETYLSFVNFVKIEKAKDLLKDPKNRSYQIGEMLGYSTPKYFAKLFKIQTGMTPNEYRRMVANKIGVDNEREP